MSVNDHSTCAGTIDPLTDTMHLRRQSEDGKDSHVEEFVIEDHETIMSIRLTQIDTYLYWLDDPQAI